MNHIRYIVLILVFALAAGPMWGQVDRREVRRGNKDFRKENYEMAFQDYLRAVDVYRNNLRLLSKFLTIPSL